LLDTGTLDLVDHGTVLLGGAGTRFADSRRVLPIRTMAGALADHLPERNVAETFVYYHIELAEHALVLAEGTPAESFVDNIHRMAFDNWDEHEALYGRADRRDGLPSGPIPSSGANGDPRTPPRPGSDNASRAKGYCRVRTVV
jgi:hypothetical protein